tara:strand:+ start:1585 stop:2481 length:897 start_codon:yes stop_codon:yes gene_type:complete
MASCNSNNTLFIGRPSKDSRNNSVSCQTGSFNPAGRCPEGIGPRKKRENVIEDLKDWVLVNLGAPVVKVELDDQNLDAAVLQALKVYEDYAPAEYYDYHVFDTEPGKSVYTLPPDVGLVRSVHFKELGSFAFQASDLDGALPIEYFYPGGAYSSIQGGLIDPIQPIWGRMGEWVLYKQYEQMYSRTASNLGGWEWVGGFNTIKIYPTPQGGRCSRVIVRYLQKCKDWEEPTEAMQDGALAYAKQMLGMIRRKYRNPPGPNGGVQLDGAELVQEGREDLKQWREDLIYRYGDLLPIRMD